VQGIIPLGVNPSRSSLVLHGDDHVINTYTCLTTNDPAELTDALQGVQDIPVAKIDVGETAATILIPAADSLCWTDPWKDTVTGGDPPARCVLHFVQGSVSSDKINPKDHSSNVEITWYTTLSLAGGYVLFLVESDQQTIPDPSNNPYVGSTRLRFSPDDSSQQKQSVQLWMSHPLLEPSGER